MSENNLSNLEACYYCGQIADTIDHVVPKSLLEKLTTLEDEEVSQYLYRRHRVKTVPACKECNCLLGSKYFPTLLERKKYIKKRLTQRYKKILGVPNWTDTELAHIGEGIRQYIINGVIYRENITKRINW